MQQRIIHSAALRIGAIKLPRSWKGEERSVHDSGEYALPRQFSDENEIVYAVLEENDVTKDDRYLDVIE